MTIMTCREFNQHTSLAQKHARNAPVIITNRGEPAFVLLSYEQYQQTQTHAKPFKSALAALTPPPALAEALANIDFEPPPRTPKQRPAVDFGDN